MGAGNHYKHEGPNPTCDKLYFTSVLNPKKQIFGTESGLKKSMSQICSVLQ